MPPVWALTATLRVATFVKSTDFRCKSPNGLRVLFLQLSAFVTYLARVYKLLNTNTTNTNFLFLTGSEIIGRTSVGSSGLESDGPICQRRKNEVLKWCDLNSEISYTCGLYVYDFASIVLSFDAVRTKFVFIQVFCLSVSLSVNNIAQNSLNGFLKKLVCSLNFGEHRITVYTCRVTKLCEIDSVVKIAVTVFCVSPRTLRAHAYLSSLATGFTFSWNWIMITVSTAAKWRKKASFWESCALRF